MVVEKFVQDKTQYCEWCGEQEYYISIYEGNNGKKETFLCKKCYMNMGEIESEEGILMP